MFLERLFRHRVLRMLLREQRIDDSNVNRGKRQKAQGEAPSDIEEVGEVAPSAAKRACLGRARPRRARLIQQVYEVKLLVCPRCAGPMRIIAVRLGSRQSFHRTRRGDRPACAGTCLRAGRKDRRQR